MWHDVENGQCVNLPHCCAYVRSHLPPIGEEKVGAVQGNPMDVSIGEAIFSLPLIDAYNRESTPIAYGYETDNGRTRSVIKRLHNYHYYGLDFKAFDKTIPTWLVRAAFGILDQNFNFLQYKNYGIVDVLEVLRQWDRIVDHFINAPIRRLTVLCIEEITNLLQKVISLS